MPDDTPLESYETTCDECGNTTLVPEAKVWPLVDAILCRHCGHDLMRQTLSKLDGDMPKWYKPRDA